MTTSDNDQSHLAAGLGNLGLGDNHSSETGSDTEAGTDGSLTSNSTQALFSSSPDMSTEPRSKLPIPSETSHIVSRNQTEVIDLTTEPPPEPLDPHICNALECAATKVLQTPETFENILSFLTTAHLLPLQVVSKQWLSSIKESPTLRLHRFVRPLWPLSAFDFELLPLAFSGLEIRRGESVHLGHWIEVQMNLHAARKILRESQDRAVLTTTPFFDPPLLPLPSYESLMITQPPIISMQAFLIGEKEPVSPKPSSSYFRSASEEPRLKSKLSCDAGITLGFLADAAEFILRRVSSQASHSGRGKDKYVLFTAIVSFCQTDIAPRKRSGTRIVTALG